MKTYDFDVKTTEKSILEVLIKVLNSDVTRLTLCYQLMYDIYEALKSVANEYGFKHMNTVFDRYCKQAQINCYRYYVTNDKKVFNLIFYNTQGVKTTIRFDTKVSIISVIDEDNNILEYANIREIDCIEHVATMFCYIIDDNSLIEVIESKIKDKLGSGWNEIDMINYAVSVFQKHIDTMNTIERMMKQNV